MFNMDVTNPQIKSITSSDVECFGKKKNYSLSLLGFKYEFDKKKLIK